MLARVIARVAAWSAQRPWAALGLAIGTCLVLALPAFSLRLDGDARRLLPNEAPAVQRFRELGAAFGAAEQTVVAIELGDGGNVEALGAAADAAAARWSDWRDAAGQPWLNAVLGGADPEPGRAAEALLGRYGWLLLDTAGLDLLIHRLDPRVVAKRVAMGGRPDVPPHRLARDPLGLWSDVYVPAAQRLAAAHNDHPVRSVGGRLLSRDGRTALLLLHPARPAQDAAFSMAFAVALDASVAELGAQHPNVRFSAIGGHLIAAADYRMARAAALSNVWQGTLCILLLFLIVHRDLRLVLFLAATLLPACGACLGVGRLLLGSELSLVVAAFAVVLVGLGVDFTIHLDAAFRRHCLRGAGPAERIAAAIAATREQTSGILAGALTSVAAFGVLLLSAFPGLRELGLVAGIGLLLMLIQVFFAAPAFLARFGRGGVRTATAAHGWGRLVEGHAGLIVVGSLLVAGLSAWALARAPQAIAFDAQARNLRPAQDPLFERQRELAQRLRLGLDQIHLVLHDADGVAVLDAATALLARLRPLADGAQPLVLLPALSEVAGQLAPARQSASLVRLRDEVDWAALETWHLGLSAEVRARWAPFLDDLAALADLAAVGTPVTPDVLLAGPLATATRGLWTRHEGAAWLDLRLDVPLGDGRHGRGVELAQALGIARDGGTFQGDLGRPVAVALTGVPLIGEALAGALRQDFTRLGIIAALTVALVLFLTLRGWRPASGALLALFAALAVTQALLTAGNVPWNLVNVAALPLLFGLGIDASIYAIAALERHPGRAGVAAAVAEVTPPLLMTTGTTVIGFATLLTNPYRGIQSLGAVAVLGMLSCLIVAIVVIPALAAWSRSRR